jgi:putative tryptophan/tyrosine transport system substrate-binding protein
VRPQESRQSSARVGVVWQTGNPANALLWRETEAAGPALGVEVISLPLSPEAALDGAFELAVRERVGALIVLGNRAFGAPAAALGVELQLPTMVELAEVVHAGGLMAYGPGIRELYRRVAYYVDRILKGTKPADLPVEQPREFDFVVNLKTAQALGLTFPNDILLQVTEVVQ